MATRKVTMPILMKELSYLLGELTVPTSGVDPRKTFLQRSLEDAWKEFPWPFSLKDDTLTFSSATADLPRDLLPEGHITIDDGNGVLPQIGYDDRLSVGSPAWYLTFDGTNFSAVVINHADFTGAIRYQFTVPDLSSDDTLSCPYPNPKTIAAGAMRLTVKADNPEADNAQEIEGFTAAIQADYAPFVRTLKRNSRVRTVSSVRGHIIGEA